MLERYATLSYSWPGGCSPHFHPRRRECGLYSRVRHPLLLWTCRSIQSILVYRSSDNSSSYSILLSAGLTTPRYVLLLAGVTRSRDVLAQYRLRLILLSSFWLPPTVMANLEHLFRVPVVEAYGMTGAAQQVASNPLPPRPRKAGSVGTAAGPEVG